MNKKKCLESQTLVSHQKGVKHSLWGLLRPWCILSPFEINTPVNRNGRSVRYKYIQSVNTFPWELWDMIASSSALHCTEQHWAELHCTELHCTELHWTELNCTESHCTTLHSCILKTPSSSSSVPLTHRISGVTPGPLLYILSLQLHSSPSLSLRFVCLEGYWSKQCSVIGVS